MFPFPTFDSRFSIALLVTVAVTELSIVSPEYGLHLQRYKDHPQPAQEDLRVDRLPGRNGLNACPFRFFNSLRGAIGVFQNGMDKA